MNAGGESSAQINVNEDGTVAITTGHPDIGGSRASMVNIVAETLGIHYRNISAQVGDTSTIGYSASTGGSRVTFAAGAAVSQAAERMVEQLRERAAMLWDIDVDAVDWKNGHAHPAGLQRGRVRTAFARRTGVESRAHRRPHSSAGLAQRARSRASLRNSHLRRGGR